MDSVDDFLYTADRTKNYLPAAGQSNGNNFKKEDTVMATKIYKVDSFKVTWSTCRDFAETLERFINEHAEQGWSFEGVEDHAFWGEWCCVIFSKEE